MNGLHSRKRPDIHARLAARSFSWAGEYAGDRQSYWLLNVVSLGTITKA
jgi:hypothetical protein